MNRSLARKRFAIRRAKQLGLLCAMALAVSSVARAQLNYSLQTGAPTFTMPSPVEMGFVNLANGNLHLEIPLGSFPQRGRIGFSAKLVYDSLVWQILCNGSSCWWSPTNGFTNAVSWWGGWKVVTTADGGTVTPTVARTNCSGGYYNVNSPFTWTGPSMSFPSLPSRTSPVGPPRFRAATLGPRTRPATTCTSPITRRRSFTARTAPSSTMTPRRLTR